MAKVLHYSGRKIAIKGRLMRIAAIHDEEWMEGESAVVPQDFLNSLRASPPADLFTFARALPESELITHLPHDWDNVAVAKVENWVKWWESLPQETRKNVRRSQRRGVVVERVGFDDNLVRGISAIYNETPIRQGRKFWHFGKSLELVKAENSTYLDRAEFIGAFYNSQLIGFIKFVMVNKVARIMQIVSLEGHSDKRPTNALLAKAVEIASGRQASHLLYGKYVYGNKESSPVTEFKRRNGFERVNFPRYYVPLTPLGALAVRFRLYRGLERLVPEDVTNLFLAMRAAIYLRRFRLQENLKLSGDRQKSPENRSIAA